MTYDEMLTMIQAAKEGKTIQTKPKFDNHADWKDDDMMHQFDFDMNYYRVKPEPKYRPFKSADEAFQEAKKHGFWVYSVNDRYYDSIAFIPCIEFVHMSRDEHLSYEDLLKDFVWADTRKHCGILEE